jgi:hypothetical protein
MDPRVSRPCWCGKPRHAAEVCCSLGRNYIHYECMGVTISDFSHIMVQNPGIYVCKSCSSPQTLTDDAQTDLLTNNPNNALFCYSETVHTANVASDTAQINRLEKSLDKKFTAFESKMLKSIASVGLNVGKKVDSFANVVKRAPALQAQPGANPNVKHAYRADPDCSILISKLDNDPYSRIGI